MAEFEPKLIAFCCSNCATSAANVCEAIGLSTPGNVDVVRIPCTGRVDILHLLKAFEIGADGAYVAGCSDGNCQFRDGNIKAKRRVARAKKLLDEVGVGGDRLEMYNMSASMGPEFAKMARKMTERIRELGPSPLRKK
ncbi:MAG: hydrogenase iron-sulfur subunit [bacterium]|nr:hydrogenase iron-sulfur subunit [bacterium]